MNIPRNQDIYMGFSPFLKTCNLFICDPNAFTLLKFAFMLWVKFFIFISRVSWIIWHCTKPQHTTKIQQQTPKYLSICVACLYIAVLCFAMHGLFCSVMIARSHVCDCDITIFWKFTMLVAAVFHFAEIELRIFTLSPTQNELILSNQFEFICSETP